MCEDEEMCNDGLSKMKLISISVELEEFLVKISYKAIDKHTMFSLRLIVGLLFTDTFFSRALNNFAISSWIAFVTNTSRMMMNLQRDYLQWCMMNDSEMKKWDEIKQEMKIWNENHHRVCSEISSVWLESSLEVLKSTFQIVLMKKGFIFVKHAFIRQQSSKSDDDCTHIAAIQVSSD